MKLRTKTLLHEQSRTRAPIISIPGPSSMDIDSRYVIKILFLIVYN